MLLANKTAVVYGGGGTIGGAVAQAFAREGARVFIASRTLARAERVAATITDSGGVAEAAEVDALDEGSVDEHADAVVEKTGGIDVSFNAVSHGDVHGPPLIEMPYEEFARPIMTAMRSQFVTARAAARHMIERGSGVILAVTAATARMVIPHVGGTAVTFDAIESLCRQLAAELAPHGIRVLWLRTTGIPEALADVDLFPDYGTRAGEGMTRDDLVAWLRGKSMLNRLTTLEDVGNVAAFMASDRAGAMTATGANITCGSATD